MNNIYPALLASLFMLLQAGAKTDERPNVILIMSDDMGYSDIGCYGGEIATPTLDALAETGLRFTQFYNTGRCCPTRASLLTGLYPHQTEMGWMAKDHNLPGYRGEIGKNCRTIAEILKPAGYRTYMSGKWHVAINTQPDGPQHNWPLQRGFEKFYGTIIGAGSFFDPNALCRGNTFITPENDPKYQPDTFYYTDAISDNAVAYLQAHEKESSEKPFFLYVAYTAAHWPMHALPEDIAKYEGKYDDGYTPTREARVRKMKQLGLLPDSWQVTPQVGNWDKIEHKEWEAAGMEVYAAMIDNMDQGIKRIVDQLKTQGDYENTLILFLQDNGGCAEGFGRNKNVNDKWGKVKIKPFTKDTLQHTLWPPMQTRDGRPVLGGPSIMPGPADTYIAYGRDWANVSNTPFREYKHYVHEGGIATPLIAHWPKGIPASRHGQLERQPGHLIDIMATCIELAGADYPGKMVPVQGVSLVPALHNRDLERKNPIFWEHEGNRAMRKGPFKLVAKGATSPWELYDMRTDRTETKNLAGTKPDLLEAMAEEWEAWAWKANVKPWPWKGGSSTSISKQKKTYHLKQGEVVHNGSPDTAGKVLRLSARVTKTGRGVIAAQGGVMHGWAVYVDQNTGAPAVCLRKNGKLETIRAGSDSQPETPYTLRFELNEGGHAVLKLGDRVVIDQAFQQGLLSQTPLDALSAGHDTNDPVGNYPKKNAFTGILNEITLKIKKASAAP